MPANLAADAVVIIHFLFILFVVLGGILVLKWRWIIWLHIPCAIWGVLIEFFGWICPLTPLENKLRVEAASSGHSGAFIDHYIMPIVYPSGLTRGMQLVLGISVIAFNIFVYVLVIFRPSDRRRQEENFSNDRTR